jgi:hypothetical protein
VAEADMVAGIEASTQTYLTAGWIVGAFAVGSIALALALGYVFSWSLVRPVKEIEARLNQIAGGWTCRGRLGLRAMAGIHVAPIYNKSNRYKFSLVRLI